MAEALDKIREMEEKEGQLKAKEETLLEYLQQGDYVYELYSVLIHSGGAMGGHYYAYIKSFEDGKWYKFNDSLVDEIGEDEISKVFGD
jgi:ubiquitin carboxyl-terminal hydrolase 47